MTSVKLAIINLSNPIVLTNSNISVTVEKTFNVALTSETLKFTFPQTKYNFVHSDHCSPNFIRQKIKQIDDFIHNLKEVTSDSDIIMNDNNMNLYFTVKNGKVIFTSNDVEIELTSETKQSLIEIFTQYKQMSADMFEYLHSYLVNHSHKDISRRCSQLYYKSEFASEKFKDLYEKKFMPELAKLKVELKEEKEKNKRLTKQLTGSNTLFNGIKQNVDTSRYFDIITIQKFQPRVWY